MNIVNKLTVRHLRQNKRRTLVTIMGVIISVAMVTAVATLAVSFQDLMIRQTISFVGEWHVVYENVNKQQLEAIKNDEETKALVLSKDRGYALLEGAQNENKPYLFIKEYNSLGFEKLPIELSAGRLPQNNREVVISKEIATKAKVDYQIGDQITLQVGERFVTDKEGRDLVLSQKDSLQMADGQQTERLINLTERSYTIVGVIKRPSWEPTWAPGYTIISYVDDSTLSPDEKVNASVILTKVKSSLYAHANELAQKNQIESIDFNSDLLQYYGVTRNNGLRKTLFTLQAIIMSVIMVGSIALIYNAFAISVSERSRHLGMLASVGATRRQKKNSVLFEGVLISLISIPIGIICGLSGIGITFWSINSVLQGALGLTETLTVVVTPWSIVVACSVSLLTILISTYLPAKKASRISAMDAIRQTQDIKLTGETVQTSKLIRKVFGIEAEIGLKNLKRNKRRYQITVFSLVISIVLFLAVSFFTANLEKSLTLTQEKVNYDIMVYTDNQQMITNIINMEDVTEYSVIKELYTRTWLEEEALAKELLEVVEQNQHLLENGKYPYNVIVHALSRESLQAYAEQIGVDVEQLIDPGQLNAIVIDTIPYKDMEKQKFVETKTIHTHIDEELELLYNLSETGEEESIGKVRIAALTNQFPMGVAPAGVGGLNVIISEQVLDQLLHDKELYDTIRTNLYLNSKDPLATQQSIEEIKEGNMYVYNVYQMRQRNEQMILLMSVFTYGFIALITAISIANIFNTISTSISLRKREFAMLKSVGMTPQGFNKMIHYESIFYGVKSLLFGLPISLVVMYLIHRALMNTFTYGFEIPWTSILYVVAAVFVIVSSSMLYSSAKVKKENIIDALKQESI